MPRDELLPGNRFVTTLTDLRTEVDAFRNGQRTSGQSGVLGYYQQSGNTWDYTDTVGTDAGSSIGVLLKAVFTDDSSQPISMTNLSFLLYANGTDTAHQITPQAPVWTDGTRSARVTYGTLNISQHTVTQNFSLLLVKHVTFYIKAYATSSSRGTLTVSLQ